MQYNQDSVYAVGFYLIIIGFIRNYNHHKFNYINHVFFWYSVEGNPVKTFCYNLMIPIRGNYKSHIILNKNALNCQKEIIIFSIAKSKQIWKLKCTKLKKLEEFLKNYLLSLELKEQILKLFIRMDAFGVKKLEKLFTRKIPALDDMPNRKSIVFSPKEVSTCL
ncbi:MAG: hypothetical protein ACTSRG_07385 [Candidatus Helarchaeota archaeon]